MKNKKGIILAGGSGSRLYPLTSSISKQLLPVYDKPMIYYPLSVLILAGITEILIICNPGEDILFNRLFGDGSHLGIKIDYAVQDKPDGIAQALIIGRDFIQDSGCVLILGDNIFYGAGLEDLLISACKRETGATVFAYEVADPRRYGVIEFNKSGKAISIIEKPSNPASKYAVTGLYFYDSKAPEIASKLKPSNRGELEITDLNAHYLKSGQLNVEVLESGSLWLDAGTHDSLLESSQFIATLQKRQAINVACLEAISFQKGNISRSQLLNLAKKINNTKYTNYLIRIADNGH